MRNILNFLLFFLAIENSFCFEPNEYRVPVGDNINLRATFVEARATVEARPTSSHLRKKVVIVLPGRSSFFEKNSDLAKLLTGYDQSNPDLPKMYCDFWCIDYRGHGKSDGRLSTTNQAKTDQRCHIDSFQTYVDDLHKVIQSTIIKHYNNPDQTDFYLLGSSFGGLLALNYIQDYGLTDIKFKKVLLVSPMIRFKTPFPRWIAWLLVYFMNQIGYGTHYALGYGDLDLSKADFSKFKSHHNKIDFYETNDMLRKNPDLITSGPTYGWVVAAFEAEKTLNTMKSLPMPTIAFLAGQDAEVDNTAGKIILENLNLTIKEYQNAGHNLLKETDEFAPGFFKDLLTEIYS